MVEIDMDGDRIADVQIEVAGMVNLTASDFIF
jgi:hypothetical protein